MWQRFCEEARNAIFGAQEEAKLLGDGFVSTEQLLLGLVRNPHSLAVHALEALGISVGRVRAEVEKQLPRREGEKSTDLSLTPRAKRVLDITYELAPEYMVPGTHEFYIGTEHLLLALIKEADGLAGRTLAKLGATYENACREVRRLQLKAAEAVRKDIVLPSREDYCSCVAVSLRLIWASDYPGVSLKFTVGQSNGSDGDMWECVHKREWVADELPSCQGRLTISYNGLLLSKLQYSVATLPAADNHLHLWEHFSSAQRLTSLTPGNHFSGLDGFSSHGYIYRVNKVSELKTNFYVTKKGRMTKLLHGWVTEQLEVSLLGAPPGISIQ